jgi:hypothetical protein
MYSRVFWGKFRPEESEEVIRVAMESIPTFKELPGYHRVTYLYDRGSGLGWAIALFDTEGHAESCVDHLKDVISAFGVYDVEPPEGDTLTLGPDTSFPMFEVIAEG